jgi:hypothetical protein
MTVLLPAFIMLDETTLVRVSAITVADYTPPRPVTLADLNEGEAKAGAIVGDIIPAHLVIRLADDNTPNPHLHGPAAEDAWRTLTRYAFNV